MSCLNRDLIRQAVADAPDLDGPSSARSGHRASTESDLSCQWRRERAKSFLHAKRWVVNREEHHRDALAPDDLALVLVALTREFVGRVELKTTCLDPMPSDPATSGPAASGELLGDVEDWTSSVPLDVAEEDRFEGVNPD